jgi:hypothetical protein
VSALRPDDCCLASIRFAGRVASPGLLLGDNRCLITFATAQKSGGGAIGSDQSGGAARVGASAGKWYQAGTPDGKGRILDEFVALTGYHRKHAIRLLNRATPASPPSTPRPDRPRLYDEAVWQALIVLWEASDRICAKRLKPLLPVLLPALERHGHLHLDAGVRARLLAVSASTIDRMLAGTRVSAGGAALARNPRQAFDGASPFARSPIGTSPRLGSSRRISWRTAGRRRAGVSSTLWC